MSTENDIEAQAAAAKAESIEKPDPADVANKTEQAQQLDEAKTEAETEKADPKPAKKKASKKRGGKKAAEDDEAERSSKDAAANYLAEINRKREESAPPPVEPDPRIDELTAERKGKVEQLVGAMVSSHAVRLDDKHEDQAAAQKVYDEARDELMCTACAGDVDEYVAAIVEEAESLEAQALVLRGLYTDILHSPRIDDGRSHAERIADVHKASAAIRRKRVQDRAKLQAIAAGKSPLDLNIAKTNEAKRKAELAERSGNGNGNGNSGSGTES